MARSRLNGSGCPPRGNIQLGPGSGTSISKDVRTTILLAIAVTQAGIAPATSVNALFNVLVPAESGSLTVATA